MNLTVGLPSEERARPSNSTTGGIGFYRFGAPRRAPRPRRPPNRLGSLGVTMQEEV